MNQRKHTHWNIHENNTQEDNMYEELYEKLPDAEAYLNRIGMAGYTSPKEGEDFLQQLILQHQCHIPFENLDVYTGNVPLSLGIHDLFDKIVSRKRGGYCFELNGLFYSLLSDCGYRAYPCPCRVLHGEDSRVPVTHRGTLVQILDRLFFCDVGFGGPMPAGPVPVEDGWEGDVCGQTFRVDRVNAYWWKLSYVSAQNGTTPVLQFSAVPWEPVDYVPANRSCSEYADSYFRQRRLVNLRTESGSKSITNDVFTLREHGDVSETTISSDAELQRILQTEFGLFL